MNSTPQKLPPGDATAPGHDDVRLHYRVSGRGPVLIAHPGGPGTDASFLGDLAGLDEVATIVWLDPRGTGGSTAPADATAYSLAHYAADVEALREHLGLEQVGLLGYSHGGMVAMRYGIEHSDRLTHLILLDTAPSTGDPDTLARVEKAMDRRKEEPWYPPVRALLDADDDPDQTDAQAHANLLAILPMYFHKWDGVAQDFVAALADGSFHARATGPWVVESKTMDLRPELDQIKAPTLVMAGDDDFICDADSAREMADRIPGARLEIVADSGHFPWIEQPAAFRRAMDSFLADR